MFWKVNLQSVLALEGPLINMYSIQSRNFKNKDEKKCRRCLGYFAIVSAHRGEPGMVTRLRSPTLPSPKKLCVAFFFNVFVSHFLSIEGCIMRWTGNFVWP